MKEQMFDPKNERVENPKIAEEMARVEKPHRETKHLGIFRPSEKQINEGIEKAEDFQRKVDPNNLEFDIKLYEGFLRDYYGKLKYEEGGVAGQLERELMEENISASLREARNQHSFVIENKNKEEKEKERLENLKAYENLKQTGLCLFDESQQTESRHQNAYYYKDGKTYLVVKDTSKTGEVEKSQYRPSKKETYRWKAGVYGGEAVNVSVEEIKIDKWINELINLGFDKKAIMEKVAGYDQL